MPTNSPPPLRDVVTDDIGIITSPWGQWFNYLNNQVANLVSGTGNVTSVFGRAGDVVAVSGDYNSSLVTINSVVGKTLDDLYDGGYDLTIKPAQVNIGGATGAHPLAVKSDASDRWAQFYNAASGKSWYATYINNAHTGGHDILKIQTSSYAPGSELAFMLSDAPGGMRFYLWPDNASYPIGTIPPSGIMPTMAIFGDILCYDIVRPSDANPFFYGRAQGTTAAVTASCTFQCAKNTNNDTDGGASIVMYPKFGGATEDGRIQYIAYGNGSGGDANAHVFYVRSGVDTVTEKFSIHPTVINAAVDIACSGAITGDGSGLTGITAAQVGAPALVNPSVSGNFVSFTGTAGLQADSGYKPADFALAAYDYVNVVADYGAVADDATSCVTAFQNAINYLLSVGGGTLFMPHGTYWFPTGAKLDPGVGGIRFLGEGMDATILHYHEGTTVPASSGVDHLFKNVASGTKYPLKFENFTVKGTLDGATRAGRWANPFWLDYYPDVDFENVKFTDIAGEAMDIHYCGRFNCRNNHFENIAADCVRARDTSNCVVTGNYIKRCGDDPIALHTSDASAIGTREGIVVSNNNMVNVGGSIRVLGARVAQIVDNTMEMGNVQAIFVGNLTGAEGNFPTRDIIIKNNILLDTLYITSATPNTIQVPIYVAGTTPRGAVSTHSTIPGYYDTTAGAWVYPQTYDETLVDDTANPVALVAGVVIKDNIVRRSRPAVAAFSNYGHGTRLWQGVAYDPAITLAHLRSNVGIDFAVGGFSGLSVSGNIIECCNRGIYFAAPTIDNQYVKTLVKDNTFFDCISRCVQVESAAYTVDMTITNNSFDGDPYRQAANSNLNGTYVAQSVPRGIDTGNIAGLVIKDNRFRNVCDAVSTNVPTKITVNDNILSCNPVNTAVGFAATNVGIGVLERADGKFYYEIIDADPTSATYGQVSLTQLRSSQTMPSTGFYVQGAFVRNSAPAAIADLGWIRLTTGTGHVLDTDWALATTADHTALSNIGINTHAQLDTAAANSVTHLAKTNLNAHGSAANANLSMGGFTFYGSAASGGSLYLASTSHATKGFIYLGSASAYDEVNDRLGIGIATPSYRFHTTETFTDLSGTRDSCWNTMTVNPASNSTGSFVNTQHYAVSAGSANIGSIYAVNSTIAHAGSGTVTNLYGSNTLVAVQTGNGNCTNAYGFLATIKNTATGTIANGFGLHIVSPVNSGGGGFTNYYGCYIAAATAPTNAWGLYSLTAKNYMSGALGIGVTAPTAYLHLAAGTATAGTAPFKYAAGGVLNTVAVAGQKEFDDVYEYITPSGTDRRTVAMNGRLSKSIAGGAGDTTLTAVEASNAILEVTGAITGNRTVTLPLIERQWTVYNNTSGAFTVTFIGATGTGIVVATGMRAIIYSDTTNIVRVTADV